MDYSYEYELDAYYCYPNTDVLRNKLNIHDSKKLKEAEREIAALRIAQAAVNPIVGKFDLPHLKRIHRFLFSDIYTWAGKIRMINISKGTAFCLFQYIEEQSNILFHELKNEDYLTHCQTKVQIAQRLSYYFASINAIHPFREGNGRTQRMFIEYLCAARGYQIDFSKITNEEMLEASIRSFHGDYLLMDELMDRAISKFVPE